MATHTVAQWSMLSRRLLREPAFLEERIVYTHGKLGSRHLMLTFHPLNFTFGVRINIRHVYLSLLPDAIETKRSLGRAISVHITIPFFIAYWRVV